jgi:hypothetical protein
MKDIQIDPRGYRFGAAITLTLAVLAVALGSNVAGAIVMALLVVLFVPGATVGPQATAQSWLFRTLVRPRIGPPAETESFRPPRFAQQLGLGFSTVALVSTLAGWDLGFFIFGGFLLFASFLNAVFNFCLGCEIYLLVKRATTRAA